MQNFARTELHVTTALEKVADFQLKNCEFFAVWNLRSLKLDSILGFSIMNISIIKRISFEIVKNVTK